MESLYVLVDREAGPLETFPTAVDAGLAMARIVVDDPARVEALRIEPLEVRIPEPAERVR